MDELFLGELFAGKLSLDLTPKLFPVVSFSSISSLTLVSDHSFVIALLSTETVVLLVFQLCFLVVSESTEPAEATSLSGTKVLEASFSTATGKAFSFSFCTVINSCVDASMLDWQLNTCSFL